MMSHIILKCCGQNVDEWLDLFCYIKYRIDHSIIQILERWRRQKWRCLNEFLDYHDSKFQIIKLYRHISNYNLIGESLLFIPFL